MFNLSFLNSGILAVASAMLIPLIIYLFAKKKPHKVIFSTIRFIKQSQQKQKRKINLKNLLLLLIRMLIILFTVLAISRPTIKTRLLRSSKNHPKTGVAIIIDNSYSMDYLVDTKTELENAKRFATKIIEMLSGDDIVQVFTLDRDWNDLHSYLIYGKPDEKLIRNIRITADAIPLRDVISDAEKEIKNSHLPNREIYVLSDMQQQELPAKTETPVFFIPVSNEKDKNNLSCQNVTIKNDFVNKNLAKIISFQVVNHSHYKQEDVICRLFIDGRTVQEKVINLESRQRKTDSFNVKLDKGGWHTGYVEVKNERLTFDNKNYFSFFYNDKPKVALITDAENIPLTLSSILDVYVKSETDIDKKDAQNLDFNELISYDDIIVYREKVISKRLEFLLKSLQDEKRGYLYIVDKNLSESNRNFISDNFDLKFETYISPPKELNVTYFDKYHPLTNVLEPVNVAISDLWKTNCRAKVLIKAESVPLVVENKGAVLWLFDCAGLQSQFLLDPSFPVLAYQTLMYITDNDNQSTNIEIGGRIQLSTSQVGLPDGTIIETKDHYYTPIKPGIYNDINESGENTRSITVNLNYAESNYKRMNKMKIPQMKILDKNWKNEILQARYGFEIWKYLLIFVLILFILEMLIVKFTEKES